MAADQRKRRLSSTSSAVGYEQYRAKKRDLRSPKYDFSFNTHVSLKWDDNGKRVVAKDDQIGISCRQLTPFIGSVPGSGAKLADVVSIPKEVFELNDLGEVLSYEVWQSVLTEKERGLLTQFLPPGVEADEVVQALLAGDNFFFGNPLLKWGSSLCSGDLHPDAIIQHEKSFKTNKKAYYSELQQYHDDMIRNLQNLKHRCASSKDIAAEIQEIISRPRRHENSILPDANGPKCHKPDENVAAMSESLSSIADEKLYYSDNQKLSAIRDAEIQKRMRNQDFIKDKHEKVTVSPNGLKVLPRPKKAEKLQKPNMTPNDGAKYMSYVKISKKQHELVKSMRQSGSSIQTKALNRLLGSLDSSNVKPYEMFVVEEKKRIHDYWLNLANKDLPTALQNWRNRQLKKRQIMGSLWHEMKEKRAVRSKDENSEEKPAPAHNEDGVNSQQISENNQEDESGTQDSMSDNDKDESDPCSSKNESPLQDLPINVNTEFKNESPLKKPPLNVNEEFDSSSMETQSLQNPPIKVNEQFDPSASVENQSLQHSTLNVNEERVSSCMENQSLQNPALIGKESFDTSSTQNKSSLDNPRLNDNEDFAPMDLNAENNPVTSNRNDTCSLLDQHVAKTSEASLISHPAPASAPAPAPAPAPIVEELPGSSMKNIWPSIGLPESYHAPPTTLHASSSGLGLRHPPVVTEQPAHLIDLESNMHEEDTTKDLLNRHTSHMPFYSAYPNRDRNELLQSLIKHDNFHQENKKPGSEFHPANVLLESANQFPSHFREHMQPPFALDHQRQKAQSELFMHQNIQNSIYSDNNRYPIQGPEHFSSLNMRDLNNYRLSNPIQHAQLNSGEMLNHNWFATENRPQGGWSSSDATVFPAPSLGSASSSDQSLYSVLTQCNMRSRGPYSPVGSTEQMIPPTKYGQEIAREIPMTSNALQQTVSPFDYLSGSEAPTTLKNSNMGWMGLGHQPPPLHDPSGKPFLKSWNQ